MLLREAAQHLDFAVEEAGGVLSSRSETGTSAKVDSHRNMSVVEEASTVSTAGANDGPLGAEIERIAAGFATPDSHHGTTADNPSTEFPSPSSKR